MPLPELFGSYLLHHLLAEGTTSSVYLAQTTGDFPRICAVKCIRPEVAALPGFKERFREDAALLVRLIHGNLVQVLEVGAVEERLFVSMEQLDGVDLRGLISEVPEQGPLPPEVALYVGLEMCEATTYVRHHRRGATGRIAFKHDEPWPLEIMLSFDGVVKVVDLGSFGSINLGQQQVARLFQSPGYAVPEVIRRQPLDVSSDLFAVGMIIWEILAGRRLVADEPETYIKHVLDGTWRAPALERKDVSGDVIRLVTSMLDIDASKRPAGIEDVRERLVAGLRHTAPTFGTSGLARVLWRRCQRRIHSAQNLVNEVIRRSPTERDLAPAAPTRSFGKAGMVDRKLDPPQDLRPGDRIAGTRYRLVRQVGEGGSSRVFAAQHIDLDRQVAIKILSSRLASISEAIAQFRMEARACSRVGHPNIVDVIDFGELDDGRFFFAMELIDGESLADVLDATPALPPARAIGMFRQIAKALQATHEQGIIHRDFKPENVMLVTREGRADFVKLLDFGVMAFGTESSGQAVGTPGYMAPEQVMGAVPTPAMDIYAVGATLYEVLAGVFPYTFDTYQEFVEVQASQAPPALRSQPGAADLPPALERIVHRALERDPGARHPSMADFEADLLRAQEEEEIVTAWDDLQPPAAVQDRRGERAKRPDRRPKRSIGLWAVVGLAAVAAGLLVTIIVTSKPPPSPPAAPPGEAAPPVRAGTWSAPRRSLPTRLAPVFGAAMAAADSGRFTHPPGTCALDLLRQIDREAPNNGRTGPFRITIAKRLRGAADRLKAAGHAASARTLYQEAALFAPDDAQLRLLAAPPASPPSARRKSVERPAAAGAKVAWLLSRVQHAVVAGRYVRPAGNNALHYLVQLKRLDPSGEWAARSQTTMTRAMRTRADELWARGDRAAARHLYRLVGVIDPRDARALARGKGKPDGGVKPAAPRPRRSGPARDPAAARRFIKSGQRLLRQGKLPAAKDEFQKAVEANPGSGAALFGLASVAFDRSDYLATVELARRSAALSPGAVRAHLLLGDAYFKLHRRGQAEKAWRRVLRLEPGNTRAASRLRTIEKR